MNYIPWKAIAVVAVSCLKINAQLSEGVEAKVPFNFIAGHQSFAPGDYRIRLYSQGGATYIQSRDGKTGGFVICTKTASVHTPTKTVLVFKRYGNEYFLRDVWIQGDGTGLKLPETRREAELEAKVKSTTTTIMASANAR
jgi:hypothetical protein